MEVFDWMFRVGTWAGVASCVLSMVAGYLAGRADGALIARLSILRALKVVRAVRKGAR